ncbi:MAG: aminoglycoside phosphotransferase family protein [Acidimicrobiia bacterium]|nr:aminoglycoside phosphotransferase family protein [Acidimicrobiia bacterium]
MRFPSDGNEFDVDWLNTQLERSRVWTDGTVASVRGERIGGEFGLSGRVYRLFAPTIAGATPTLVAKIEAEDEIRRAVTFRAHNERLLAGVIPASYGSYLDSQGQGVILLEDIPQATQGDDLAGCTLAQALDLIDIVARLHATTWFDAASDAPIELDRWSAAAWAPERWSNRLEKARERYPDHYTAQIVERLAACSDEATAAIQVLALGPASWVHRDPHLDNILWRADGSPVLLDWSGAAIGPPAVDVAVLLVSLAFRNDAPIDPDQLLARYASSLQRYGVDAGLDEITRTAALALRIQIRGMIGWAGAVRTPPDAGRKLALRNDYSGRVLAGIRWLDARPVPS